ncbi:MAG: substrate-binding domain-containing protein, partial [Agromyces sp.]
ACEAHGMRVGQDIAVIGIDGHEYAEAFDLATVQQYPAAQGALAAETLIAELDGKPPVSSFLPSRWSYIARGSIGVAR